VIYWVYESPLPRGDKADMLTGMALLAGLVSKEPKLSWMRSSSGSTRRSRSSAS